MQSILPPLFSFLASPVSPVSTGRHIQAKAAALILAPLLWCNPALAQTQLFVNEIMASNSSGITDVTGAHEDWFEIYNPNDLVVDIAGYYLSDKTSNPKKHRIPSGFAETRIPPHGYLVIWASEKPERGPLHAAFALSASGENVVISAPDGSLTDVVTFGAQTKDVSYGRYPDGSASWILFSGATPGANNAGGTTLGERLPPPVFSVPAGFKTGAFGLSLTHPDPGVTIRYTTDGSEPVESDAPLVWKYKNKYNYGSRNDAPRLDQGLLEETNQSYPYSLPIRIDDRSAAANRVSMKSSTESYEVSYLPENPVYKGTVIRAKAFKAGSIPSETVTKTYFVSPAGANRYSMPVISLVSDERSFFDYSTGIYTAGRQYDRFLDDNTLQNGNCWYTNYTMDGGDWERRGSFELFEDGQVVFNQENVGFRTHGYCSRRSPQKSLRLYSDTYFNHTFFPDQKANPKRLLLRTRGNEPAPSTEFRDLFCQKLVEFLHFDSQSSKPAVIFMNGEYWGLQSIRERFDRFYLEGKYGVDRDNLDVIQIAFTTPALYEVEEGDSLAFVTLKDFISNNDLQEPANYEKLKTMIDLDNYTDYQIAELVIDNHDWPFHNIRLWRTKVPAMKPGAPYGHDGRWRLMFYDGDITFSSAQTFNNFANASGSPSLFGKLFKKILLNPDFRTSIISRTADLLNSHFTADRANVILDRFRQMFEPLMPECVDRWKEEPKMISPWSAPQSMEGWDQSVRAIKNFVTARPVAFREMVRRQFGSELADFDLSVSVSDPADGFIRINQIDITAATPGIPENPYPWTGIYFKTIPVKLTAVPTPDSYFVMWQGSNGFSSQDPGITITSDADLLEYHAIFRKKPVLSDLVVNGTSINPRFSPTTSDYSLTIPAATGSVTVTPTFGERTARANIGANSGSYVPIANGAASQPIEMAPGINKIRLQVYDFDGTGARFYTVTVNREMTEPGYAFEFEGSGTSAGGIPYVQINKRIETADFTLETWIRTSDSPVTGTEGYLATALFNSDMPGDANDFSMGMLNNRISFFDGSAKKTTIGETNVADGHWHHVAVVREAGVAVSIYVDGRLDKKNTSGAGRATLNENSYITLGGNPADAGQSFPGAMDETRIWTTARTAAELSQNMCLPPAANAGGLKAYYKFDIGINDPATTVPDLTGNGNTGTIGNLNTATINRVESYAMVVPGAVNAADVDAAGFTVSWVAPSLGTAERYFLDVSTDRAFAPGTFLPGFEALQVNGTSQRVTIPAGERNGRTAATDYYLRVRADKTSVAGQGAFSGAEIAFNPLPVTLISFTVKKTEYANLLEWTVTSELAFDRYVIERSMDAKTFAEIGSIRAVADGKPEVTGYSYVDEHLPVAAPATIYYRLRMVGRAGGDQAASFTFSRIVSITRQPEDSLPGQVYPNPSNGKMVYVDIRAKQSETWQMTTFSAGGIRCSSFNISLKKGVNKVSIPVENLPAGVYIISLRNSLLQETVRKMVIE